MKLVTILILLFAPTLSMASITITTKTLPNGTVGANYSATIVTSGGCAPYTWTEAPSLPSGITGSPVKGTLILNGDPTTAGSYTFSVSVKGCGGHTATISYTVDFAGGTQHTVSLSWNASTTPGITSYNIYRNNVKIGSTPNTLNYTDTTVVDGQTYTYNVTAVDPNGESAYSDPVMVTIPAS